MVLNVLSVAEKPSVAKEIAKILAGGEANYQRRPGHSQYNQLYEINNCPFKGQHARMVVTSVTGHLMEIEFDREYKSWSSCRPVDLFDAPIQKYVKKENEKIETTLIEQAKKCQALFLWLDCDTEGENIAFEVIDVCKKANPRIDIYRARFSALIERDILRTSNNPDRPNKNFSDAVDARQEIDLRLGAAFTRFQTLRLQNKYAELRDTLISYGPCQFPTLGFVVDRHLKIDAFQPETFWTINFSYECDDPDERSGKLSCNFSWSRGHIYDRYVCTVLYDMCLENGGNAIVMNVEARPTTRHRPVPMNTIQLQKSASTLLRMSSDHTMAIAEALYQRGILSYPRTETDFFKEGFDLNTLIEEQRGHSQWGEYASNLLTNGKFLWPKNGGHDDQAHPPIHPTKKVEPNEFGSDDEKKIYELVTRHFLACCSHDGKGNQTTITVRMPDINGEIFTAYGLMIIERNWLDVYTYDKWVGHKVPKFDIGDEFKPKSFTMSSGVTTPPPPISESELINDMDKNGIGTDATIAEHIKTIQKREYVIKDNQNRFKPTKLGLALVEAYNSMGYQLTKPFLRASMESDCHKISRGELRKEDVVAACIRQMRDCFITVNREVFKLDNAVAKYFSGIAFGNDNVDYQISQRNLSRCGVCKNLMDLKVQNPSVNENREFIRRLLCCDHCKQSHTVPGKGDLKAHDAVCPICSFQVLVVVNRETQREHTICPYCFKNPPGPPDSEDGINEFRCFGCAKSSCALSGRVEGSDADIAPCSDPTCNGCVRISKAPGGYVLSCNSTNCNKKSWWLPKRCITSALVKADNVCRQCAQRGFNVLKIDISIDLRVAPRGLPGESSECPCCSEIWEEFGQSPLPLPSTPKTLGNGIPHVSNTALVQNPQIYASDYSAALSGINFNDKRAGPRIDSTRQGAQLAMEGPDAPNCQCGNPSKLLTVQKEGPNKGRTFFSCASPRDQAGNCGFFCWSDEVGKISNPSYSRSIAPMKNNYTGGHASSGRALEVPVPQCICEISSVIRTVTKEGPNSGRTFFACSKPRDASDRCDFFKWTDDIGQRGSANSSNSNFGRGTSSSFSGRQPGSYSKPSGRVVGQRNDIICSKCQQAGHFARQCPNR